MNRWLACILCTVAALLLFGGGPTGASRQDKSAKDTAAYLTVRGVADKPVVLKSADLEALTQKAIKVKDKGGEEVMYEGVSLADALKHAGLDFQADLHGKALTRFLLVEAADKYRIVFSLPELDPAFTDRVILIATRQNGKPLTDAEGPCRIIVPDDKRQARWVRQVRMLTIMDAVSAADRNKKP